MALFKRRKDGKPYGKWIGQYRDADGKLCRKALSADKGVAKKMLAKLEGKADEQRAGLVDPTERHRQRPLADHLDDYRADLEARQSSAMYVRTSCQRVGDVIAGCKFDRIADLDVVAVRRWIVEQLRLAALPKGHPERRQRPFAKTSANHYVGAVKTFSTWLFDNERCPADRLARLKPLPIEDDVDLAIVRRSLSPADLSKLLNATLASDKTFRGDTYQFTPYDRYVLYLTASQTGLRAKELSLLRSSDLRLDGDRPELTARASTAKNAKTKDLPVHPDLAPVLRDYLVGRPVNRPIWPGVWARDGWGVKMVRSDLAAAGIAFKNEAGERFDFHSLRVQCGTDLARAGVPLVYAQRLLRHSTPTLTAKYYTRPKADELAEWSAKRIVPTVGQPVGASQPIEPTPDELTPDGQGQADDPTEPPTPEVDDPSPTIIKFRPRTARPVDPTRSRPSGPLGRCLSRKVGPRRRSATPKALVGHSSRVSV